MLQLINAELISIQESEMRQQYPGYRYNLISYDQILRYADGQKRDRYENRDKLSAMIPLNRQLMTLSIPTNTSDPKAKITQMANWPTALKVYDNDRGIPMVEARLLDATMDNRANLYVIAYPYRGRLKVIPESPLYRIYKGVSVKSVKPFWFEGKRYTCCLYLIVEPNLNLFTPDHKYHQDKIEITMESNFIYNDKKSGEARTNHNTMTVTIKDGSGNYEVTNETETLDGAIGLPEIREDAWTTFRFYPKDENGERTPTRNKEGKIIHPKYQTPNFAVPSPKVRKGGQRESFTDGDMIVTTNRHGIRKEIPIRNKDNYNRGYNNQRGGYQKRQPQNDLDRMMQKSGMFDVDKRYDREDNRRGNGRNNRGNNGRGRRR